MSLTMVLHVGEGIVMASDSRLAVDRHERRGDQHVVHVSITGSDACRKLFVTPNHVGIGAFGAVEVDGRPITVQVERFVAEQVSKDDDVDAITDKLLAFFKVMAGPPDARFFVAGYKSEAGRRVQHVYRVTIAEDEVKRQNEPGAVGAVWGGESDVLARLVQPVVTLDDNEKPRQRLPHFGIRWSSFTLQDAVDYARYAIRVTGETMRFQSRPQTVGGPIDVLAIRPDGAIWIERRVAPT